MFEMQIYEIKIIDQLIGIKNHQEYEEMFDFENKFQL
jgi:hypothetical protein